MQINIVFVQTTKVMCNLKLAQKLNMCAELQLQIHLPLQEIF